MENNWDMWRKKRLLDHQKMQFTIDQFTLTIG